MLYASSQVPFTFRRNTNRESPSRRCFSTNGLNKKRRQLRLGAGRCDSAEYGSAEYGLAKCDLAGYGSEVCEAEIDAANDGVLDKGLINDLGANNPAIDTQVNRSQSSGDALFKAASSLDDRQETALQLKQLQKRLEQQQQLRQIEHKLRDSLNLESIFGVAVVEAALLFEAQQAVLMEYSSQSQQWALVAQYCRNESTAWHKRCCLVQEEFPDIARQLFQGETLQLFSEQPRPTTETRQWLACYPGSWLIVPVPVAPGSALVPALASSQPSQLNSQSNLEKAHWEKAHWEKVHWEKMHWGVLALALPEEATWLGEATENAKSLAIELSSAIAQAKQYQSLLAANAALQKLALSDGLTGLANRRRFDEHLLDEWQRLARDQQPLSLILCDLDHFKQYNDSFGHPAGDRCLVKVAAALKAGPRRPADLVARYGGEEFAIILPNTDTNGAWRIAQKLHSSIRALNIAHSGNEDKAYVTVTMGVSTIIPGHDATAQVLVQAADLALYHAKQQGRDRTYVHAHYNTVTEDTHQSAAPIDLQPKIAPPEDG